MSKNSELVSIEEVQARQARIEELEAKLAAVKSFKPVYLKVSEKGCVSIYNIRRFPISLYVDEIKQVLGMVPEIEAFIVEHEGELATRA